MSRSILYLTPFPPERSGIADYAALFKQAIEEYTNWELQVDITYQRVIGNSIGDYLALRNRVIQWKAEGRLQNTSIVHAEIGYKHHDEFYTLYWLKQLAPDLSYCITIHDPPLVIAPAFFPLNMGLTWKRVRHGLRILDYTPIGKAFIRSVLSKADSLFVLSNGGKAVLQKVIPTYSQLYTLPHINYRSRISEKKLKDREEQAILILFIGFWGKEKGLDILIKAMEIVTSNSHLPIKLVLAGGAEKGDTNREYVEKVLNMIQNSPAKHTINVVGYIPDEELENLFDAADIFVMPYTRGPGHSSSGALVRAMGAGLPIVATDTGVLGEDVHHMETGLLIPPEDPTKLAAALELLITNPSLRLQLGQQAQHHIFSEHSRQNIAHMVGTIYDSIATHKKTV